MPGKYDENIVIHKSENGQICYRDLKKVIKSVRDIEKAYIPYNDPRGHNYYRYDIMLFLSGIKDIHSFNIHEKDEKLNRLTLLFKRPLYQFFERRAINYLTDTLIYPFLYAILYLFILLKPYKKKKDAQIVFITHFGMRLPSARVRSYNFSRMLNELGVVSEVVSTDDMFDISNEGTSPFEKAIANLRLAALLINYPKASFCVLKPDYHFLAPYLVHKIKGNKIIFDQDDWDFHLRVFGVVNEEHIVKKMMKVSCCNLVASRALEEAVRGIGHKADYIPTGVDTEAFKPTISKISKNDEIPCAWIGMIWGRKVIANLLFLLHCFKKLKNKKIIFHIAAGGIHVEKFRRKGEKEIGNRLKLTKWISPEKIPDFINSTDIGVMPFIGRYDYNKAKSPTKLFEFMACGKPCITSPIGEMKTIIRHGENGFLAETKEEFVKYIELLANDATLRDRIGKNARKTAEEKYSLEGCGKRLYEVLKKKEII